MFVTFFHELKSANLPVTLREYQTLMEALELDLAGMKIDMIRQIFPDRIYPLTLEGIDAAMRELVR